MTIDEIIEKEELKVDTLLNSLTENTTSFAVEDSINDILQQEYLTLVNAIGHMAKFTGVDTRACGDIVALSSAVSIAVQQLSKETATPKTDTPHDPTFSELKTLNRSGAVCKFLNISRRLFYELRDTGQLPAPYRIGGADMWSRDDLIAWLETTRQTKQPD